MTSNRHHQHRHLKLSQGLTASGVVALVLGASTTGSAASGTVTSGAGSATAPSVQPATVVPSPPSGDNEAIGLSQSQMKVSTIALTAMHTFGTSYAGTWIDNSTTPPTVHIMVTGTVTTSDEATFLHNLPTSSHVAITHVKYAQRQLSQYQDTLVNYATAHYSTYNASRHPIRISPDPIDNAVQVTLSRADAGFLSQLRPLIPTDALRVQWQTLIVTPAGGPGWTSTVTRNDFPPYKAGKNVTSAYGCTQGFLVSINGAYKGVTAGHCTSGLGTALYSSNGTQISSGGVVRSYGSTGDYEAFGLKTTTAKTGYILAETNGSSSFIDDVIGREAEGTQGVGLEVCASGRTTNAVVCGAVTAPWPSSEIMATGRNVGNLACSYTLVSRGGDSGGPVYVPYPTNNGTAAGIIQSFGATNRTTCWTVITAALQALTNHTPTHKPAYIVDYDGKFS